MRAAIAVCVLVCVLAAPRAAAAPDADGGIVREVRTIEGLTIQQWHGRAVKNRRAINRLNHVRERMRVELGRRHHPVSYALKLAATIYGVPYSQLSAVAWCESRHYPWATNGIYRGVFQEGPMFERGPFGRAGFSVFDPVANALTAAYTVSREGWSQWSCRP